MLSEFSTCKLPRELIEEILDHVAADSVQESVEYLAQCALVSRSFRPRSQQHLFSSIAIGSDSEPRSKKIHALLNILQENTAIATYIRELSLTCRSKEYSWIYKDPAFIKVMEKLSTFEQPLRRLILQADDWGGMRLKNARPFRDKFFQPFIAPFITSLSLSGLLGLPIEVVTSCVNLMDLELQHVRWQEREPTRKFGAQVIHLRSLIQLLSRPALERLIAPPANGPIPALDLSQLKTFTIYTDCFVDLAFEQQIIDASRESLEEIYILTRDKSMNDTFHGSLNLRECTCLRRIQTQVLFPEDSLVSFRQTLSTMRPKSLKTLSIDAKVGFVADCEPEAVFHADWADISSEVARVMMDGSRFELNVAYMYGNNRDMDMADYKAHLNEILQHTVGKLRREQLNLLEDDPRFTAAISHSLAYDGDEFLCMYNLYD